MIHGAQLETTATPTATTSRIVVLTESGRKTSGDVALKVDMTATASRIVRLMDNTRKNSNHVSAKPGTVVDDSNAALFLLMKFRLPTTGSDRTKAGLGTSSTLQTKIGF